MIALGSSIPLFFISTSKHQLFVCLISIAVIFFISFINKLLFVVTSIFFLILSSIAFHMINLWGAESLKARVQAAYLSPTYESIEYLDNFWGMSDSIIITYLFIFVVVSALYLIKDKYKFQHGKKISMACITLMILLSQSLWFFYLMQPFPLVQAVQVADDWKQIVDARLEYLKKREPSLALADDQIVYDKVVLLLGESVNREHMSAYGYQFVTTPFLDEQIKSKSIYQFNQAISPANQTRYSIPLMLTNAKASNFYEFTSLASIVSDFNDIGFKTYWLSNQYMSGMHDSYIATIASEAQEVKVANYVYEHSGMAESNYDEILLDYLQATNSMPLTKEFYVLHLLGSHFQYTKRYPKHYGLFKQPRNIIESYDNSIKYTDDIFKQIHSFFTKSKTLFIYVADHGQVVNVTKSGHAFYNPSYRDEYNIPFFIYSNVENKRLDAFYANYKDSVINMENLKDIIAHIISASPIKFLTSSQVLAIDPANIIDYSFLKLYRETTKNKSDDRQ